MNTVSEMSNAMPKQNFNGTYGIGEQLAKTSKVEPSSNASKEGSATEIIDVVSISENAQNKASKDFIKSSGSIEVNNNRIKYSLTKSDDLVIQIVDKKSNEVVRQIPPEELIKIKEMVSKALEENIEA